MFYRRRLGGYGRRSYGTRRPRGALYRTPRRYSGYRRRLGTRRGYSRYYIGGRRY